MNDRRAITAAEFERLTAPQLLLFLSADLENSTRLKHSLRDQEQVWFGTVMAFMSKFPTLLSAEQARITREQQHKKIEEPSLWKTMGDELIFVCPLKSRVHVKICLDAFIGAVQRWNEKAGGIQNGQLPLRGSAWVAGFPIANAIIRHGQIQDYIGPSMDAGFRISKFSTSRKLAISVELAWLMLECKCSPQIHFNGRSFIKGVAEGFGYPELWIEIGASEYQALESELSGRSTQADGKKMKELCRSFIHEFGVPSFCPFIPEEKDMFKLPDGYSQRMTGTKQFLRDNIYFISEDPKEPKPATEAAKEGNKILAQLPNDRRVGKKSKKKT